MENLEILNQGPGWVAINKPHHLSVHNADSSHSETDCVQILKKQLKTSLDPIPVHRLDVGTSGVLLFALNKDMAKVLAEEFSKGQTKKEYMAVLKGIIEKDVVWSFPLTDKAEGRRNPQGSGARKECLTKVFPLNSNHYFTLAKILLETGRTHQIRRHAAIAKHPVIGDERYSNPDYVKKIAEIYGLHRLVLHAYQLGITIQGKSHQILCPFPEDLTTNLGLSSV